MFRVAVYIAALYVGVYTYPAFRAAFGEITGIPPYYGVLVYLLAFAALGAALFQ